MNLKELLEARAKAAAEVKRLAALIETEKRGFTAEERAAFQKIDAEYIELSARIEVAKRAAGIAAEQVAPVSTTGTQTRPGREDARGETAQTERRKLDAVDEETRATAIQAWCRAQMDMELDDAQLDACRRAGIRPGQRTLVLRLRREPYSQVRREIRAQSSLIAGSGGVLVPEGFVAAYERALLQFGALRPVASVIRTTGGGPLPWPTVDDTGNEGAELGENVAVSEQDLAFGAKVFNAYKYTSKLIRVSSELLEDSAIDLVSLLGSSIGERIARITERRFTTGTGAGQPQGVVTGSTLGKTAAAAAAITADEIIDLLHSVDPAYRQKEPGVGFMMHDGIWQYVRKLKYGDGTYLLGPFDESGPDRIKGFPVYTNQAMQSTVATGTKTILFGDLRKYKIRDVGVVRIRRLVERYADSDQEGFVGFARADGALLDAGTGPVKHLLQA